MINKLTTNKDVEELRKFVDENGWAKSHPHWLWGKTEGDVMLKWGGILRGIKSVVTKDSMVLDLACGDSPLPKIISGWCNHLYSYDANKLPDGLPNNCTVKLCKSDEYLKTVKDDFFDIVYDSCAVIHFNAREYDPANEIYNKGFYDTLVDVKRCLKPGGYFFVVCDCHETFQTGEFITEQNLYKMIKKVGFQVPEPVNLERNNDTFLWKVKIHPGDLPLNVVSFVVGKKP